MSLSVLSQLSCSARHHQSPGQHCPEQILTTVHWVEPRPLTLSCRSLSQLLDSAFYDGEVMSHPCWPSDDDDDEMIIVTTPSSRLELSSLDVKAQHSMIKKPVFCKIQLKSRYSSNNSAAVGERSTVIIRLWTHRSWCWSCQIIFLEKFQNSDIDQRELDSDYLCIRGGWNEVENSVWETGNSYQKCVIILSLVTDKSWLLWARNCSMMSVWSVQLWINVASFITWFISVVDSSWSVTRLTRLIPGRHCCTSPQTLIRERIERVLTVPPLQSWAVVIFPR